jgi:hypothetical protein
MGRIDGVNIATNHREEVYAGAGWSFHPGVWTLRPGYSASWMAYDRDLGGFPSTDADGDGITAPGIGGYFSPFRFLNQMVRLDATLPIRQSLVFMAGAGVGRQQVEDSRARDFDHRMTSSDGYFGVRVTAGERVFLGAQITYMDVASAFDRTVLRALLGYGF